MKTFANRGAPNAHFQLDDSETSMLPATDFYIQPVPIVNKESDVKANH